MLLHLSPGCLEGTKKRVSSGGNRGGGEEGLEEEEGKEGLGSGPIIMNHCQNPTVGPSVAATLPRNKSQPR